MPDGLSPRKLPAGMADRLIVALDLPSVEEAREAARRLDDVASVFKIGLWLLLAPGVDRLIGGLRDAGKRVFIDAKMYDIPQTVERGVAMAARIGANFVTVHGDQAILEAAVQGRQGGLQILAVTVLTSLDDRALASMGHQSGARALVLRRAADAVAAGCDGIIASAEDDPRAIRRHAGSDRLLVVTPGIRPAGVTLHDHQRSATPEAAIRAGADYLVVGRPIVQAPDPAAAARAVVAEMEAGAR